MYNSNSPLSIVDRAKTVNNSSLKWVYDAEIFSVTESKLFHSKISEINQGSEAFGKNSAGEYMIPIENKIIFTDGNYDSPYVREIVEVLTEYQTEFEDIRECIYSVEKGESSKQEAARYVQNTFGKGRIVSYTSGNNGVHGWENGQRKGKSRRAVIGNYLRKQYRGRNDRTSQKAPINEIAPINEASSSDGVFFDAEKTKYSLPDIRHSLSEDGEQGFVAPMRHEATGKNARVKGRFFGKDVLYRGDAIAQAKKDKLNVYDSSGKEVYTYKAEKKSLETIAKEVIRGDWGNGAERRKKLEAAVYNYDEVQKRVNALLR